MAKLFKAGDQVPAIPLMEVVGKATIFPPEQIGGIAVKFGVTTGFTIMDIDCEEAH